MGDIAGSSVLAVAHGSLAAFSCFLPSDVSCCNYLGGLASWIT